MNAATLAVAVLFYPAKAGAAALAEHVAAALPRIGAATAPTTARAISLQGLESGALRAHTHAIVVGGDGSILGAARLCAPLGIPLLPVQLGQLGLLAEVEAQDIDAALPHYLRGDCWRDARLMLTATLDAPGGGQVPETEQDGGIPALNEIVAARGVSSGPIRVDIAFDGSRYGTVWADALIVATPTGSSAYTRSAGGPIIHPAVASLSLTAVAPQSGPPQLLVIPADESVELRVTTDAHDWILLADGLVHSQLPSGTTVTVRRAPHDAIFLRRGDRYRLQRRLRDLLVGNPRPRLGASG
ncbi:MAG: NAD(+)/NADH kinase [Chloroflexota bacterium]|nr:NAD(+)/NADH kinase [Chloroflexota bacterium]